jgi:hypothetical protein
MERVKHKHSNPHSTARIGVYRGEPLFIVADEPTKFKITACKAVRDDLGKEEVPRVITKSPNEARAQPVVDVATAQFVGYLKIPLYKESLVSL